MHGRCARQETRARTRNCRPRQTLPCPHTTHARRHGASLGVEVRPRLRSEPRDHRLSLVPGPGRDSTPPPEAPSSGEARGIKGKGRQEARLLRMPCMKAVHDLQVVHVGCVLPSRAVVSRPLHQVLQLFPPAEESINANFVNVVLVFAVNLDGVGRRLAA